MLRSLSWLVVGTLALPGCHSEEHAGPLQANGGTDGGDANVATGGAANAGGLAGAAGSTEPAPCGSPIEGTAPFAVALSASPGSPALSAALYFPMGRVANAPVLLARPDSLNHDLFVWKGTLGPNAEASSIDLHDHCVNGVSGDLVGPSGGIEGQIETNVSPLPGDDVVVTKTAPGILCASGQAPAAELAPSWPGGPAVLPTQPVALSPTTPVDPITLSTLSAPWISVGIVAEESGGVLGLSPKQGAFPPGEWPLDLSSIHDVMGQSYAAPTQLSVIKPAAILPDPLLDTITWDAVGLAAGSPSVTATPGRLTIQPQGSGIGAVIAIGGSAQNAALRVKHRYACPSSPYLLQVARVVVVGADGSAVDVPCACTQAPEDQVVSLPGQAPWYLVVDALGSRPIPCSFGPSPNFAWELDEIAFDP